MRPGGTLLKRPEDGIMPSSRQSGWLARRWLKLLDTEDPARAARIATGRRLAKRGRVRQLRLGPGTVYAEVVADEVHDVTLRFKPFSPSQWERLVRLASNRLDLAAALFDGDLPEDLVESLDRDHKVRLLPSPHAMDGDCTCPDFRLLCEHAVAVYALTADMLDGDPSLLLTLRGWPPARVEAAVRAAWGGDGEVWRDPRAEPRIEPVPASGPRRTVSSMELSPRNPSVGALQSVGAPAGGQELISALEPIYRSGAQAALDLLDGSGTELRSDPISVPVSQEYTMSEATPNEAESLTERIVELLSGVENMKTKALATELGEGHQKVRAALIELENLGLVVRTGNTRGTRWWLG